LVFQTPFKQRGRLCGETKMAMADSRKATTGVTGEPWCFSRLTRGRKARPFQKTWPFGHGLNKKLFFCEEVNRLDGTGKGCVGPSPPESHVV
jgi:hypothetical protein